MGRDSGIVWNYSEMMALPTEMDMVHCIGGCEGD